MILGLGNDIADIRRIEKLLAGKRFAEKCFTKAERIKAGSRKETMAATYAKRFAAKEACAKALGTGIGKDARWLEIEITNLKSGAPTITLSGAAQKRLEKITPRGMKARLLLALSDAHPFALAQVLIVADRA